METFNILAIVLFSISLLIALINFYYTIKIKKKYEKLDIDLIKGEKLSDVLKKYIDQLNELNNKDNQIIDYCNKLNQEVNKSITKIGLIKYNLYNTTKHDLSFALALLDKSNSGVVINSVYGIDSSNVYCKLIINGNSKNKLSEEEKEALNIAINK